MLKYELSEMEERFAYVLWERVPISSKDLTELAHDIFSWKRTTMYTMLRKLIDKELFENNNGMVDAIVTLGEYESRKTTDFLNDSFEGSLPKFITAFTRQNNLSENEIEEILEIINNHMEDGQ
ncbi:MAG: BlaI/MecI/CopY family transcriptional regulator [Erysipelothrix sp.]|nr:BlaI/MecI/CopY family transcriptional regulator [Erysipelothrix sp.]